MIHTLLNLTRPMFVVDCETTGTDVQRDRIVEIGFEQWMPDAPCEKCHGIPAEAFKTPCEGCQGTRRIGGLVKEWRTYVDPTIPIPESVTKVHGITNEFIKACCRHCQKIHVASTADHEWAPLPTFKQLAASLAKGFTDCDYAGKNCRFDLRINANEMARAGQPWSYAGARIVDAERLEQLAVPRDLGSLHEKYVGRKHDGAHGALSDVRASTTVICKQLEAHAALPRDLDALHNLQWPNFIDAEGKFRFVDGVPYCFFGKWNGKPMREIERSYFDWLLSADFGADIKALAADAKLGKYPEVKR